MLPGRPLWCGQIEEPAIFQVEERQLWEPKRRVDHVATMHLLNMAALLFQVDLILSKGGCLIFHFELPIVDPDSDRLARLARLPAKPPLVEPHVAVPIQVARVARSEQNTIEGGWRIHAPFVPIKHLQRGMAPVLTALVPPVALMVVVKKPFTMDAQRLASACRPHIQRISHFSANIERGL